MWRNYDDGGGSGGVVEELCVEGSWSGMRYGGDGGDEWWW